MTQTFETTEYGFAAWVSEIKGCYVEERPIARGRAKFVVHLDNGDSGHSLHNEWLNSDFFRVDRRVVQMKKATYFA